MKFVDLISPLTIEQFMSDIWEKMHLHIPGNNDSKFEKIISSEDIADFLSRSDIRHPSLRLVQNGKELELNLYTKELRLGAHRSHDLIDNDKMFSLYNQGATIVLQFLQHNLPKFSIFTNSLEDTFGCNVQGSSFITPPKAQGFTSHYDTYSFFVLQISGSKRWNIYPRTKLLPIREDRDEDEPWVACEPIDTIDLKAGDFLYVPRGWFHAAETTSDTSIHMTLGFFLPTWLDIYRASLSEMLDSNEIRTIPEMNVKSGKFNIEPSETAFYSEFLAKNIDLNAGFQRLQREYSERRVDSRSHRLIDLIQNNNIGFKTEILIHPDLKIDTSVSDDKKLLNMRFANNEVTLPIVAKSTIDFIILNGPVVVEEIIDDVELESRLTIIRALVRAGMITIH
jgi:ribosomal protein L16 Arg81 hydroxylase